MQTYHIGKNKTKINLQDTDFLAQGGQAKIYAKWDSVYKIYHNPKLIIPEAKLNELDILKDIPEVILPRDTIYDGGGNRVGFVFDWIKDAEPIYNMGSNGYWRDINMTSEKASRIVSGIIETTQKIHEKGVLIVDHNPFNILVDQKTLQVHFFIDTEPWQTKNFKATVIMPGIRDWQGNGFTELTDWYSVGIVTCEFYLGVHPFKGGVHPRFGPKDMELRMKNNAPLFDKGVRLNSRIRDFSVIPNNYLNWYVEMFLHGKRLPPPTAAGTVVVKKVAAAVGKAVQFKVTLLQEYDSDIVWHDFRAGKRIVKTKTGVYVDNDRFDLVGNLNLVIVENEPIVCRVEDSYLVLIPKIGKIAFEFMVDDFMVSNNRIYAKNGAYLNEICITKMGSQFIASMGQTWDIMPNASKLFDGLVIQNMLGKPFFVIPGICKVGINELIGYKVIAARRFGRTVIVIANKQGQDFQLIFVFGKQFDHYECQVEQVLTKDINISVLDKMVMVTVPEDGKIVIKSLVAAKENRVEDAIIKSEWNLSAEGDRVIFFIENKLYQLRMK